MREVMRELANSELAVLEPSRHKEKRIRADSIFDGAGGTKERVSQNESFAEKGKISASSPGQQLDEIKQGFEVQLRHRDELVRRKDSALRGLEEEFSARIRDLENRVAALLKGLGAKMVEGSSP